MYEKKINLNDTDSMRKFLKNHFKYYTMNSWNRCQSYANNVKIHRLDIPDNLRDKAYDFIGVECFDYECAVSDAIMSFCEETGYAVGFNGRNAGYIVLYDTRRDENNKLVAKSTGLDDDAYDIDEMDTDELKDRVKLVTRFDKLCDEIREIFIEFLKTYEIKTVEILVPQTKTIAVPIGEESEE